MTTSVFSKPTITLNAQLQRSVSNRGAKELPCVIRTPKGHILRATEVIGKSLPEIASLAANVDNMRHFPLSNLGPTDEMDLGGTRYEVLLGLEFGKLASLGIGLVEIPGISECSENRNGFLVLGKPNIGKGNINFAQVKQKAIKLTKALDRRFDLELSVAWPKVALSVAHQFKTQLMQSGINWFFNATDPTIVQNPLPDEFNIYDRLDWCGIVAWRPVSPK